MKPTIMRFLLLLGLFIVGGFAVGCISLGDSAPAAQPVTVNNIQPASGGDSSWVGILILVFFIVTVGAVIVAMWWRGRAVTAESTVIALTGQPIGGYPLMTPRALHPSTTVMPAQQWQAQQQPPALPDVHRQELR